MTDTDAFAPPLCKLHSIRMRIEARSGGRCEGSPAYPECRAANGLPHPVTGTRVVLTLARLDHQPENCADDNLRHWCQQCHNTYDAPHRAAVRALRSGAP